MQPLHIKPESKHCSGPYFQGPTSMLSNWTTSLTLYDSLPVPIKPSLTLLNISLLLSEVFPSCNTTTTQINGLGHSICVMCVGQVWNTLRVKQRKMTTIKASDLLLHICPVMKSNYKLMFQFNFIWIFHCDVIFIHDILMFNMNILAIIILEVWKDSRSKSLLVTCHYELLCNSL